MDENDLSEMLNAILEHGSSRYTTPSGALLHLLRRFAREQNIEGIAIAANLYCTIHSANRNFIRAQIPPILTSCYFTTLEEFDYPIFRNISLEKNWSEHIRNGAFDPNKLQHAVDAIIQRVRIESQQQDEDGEVEEDEPT